MKPFIFFRLVRTGRTIKTYVEIFGLRLYAIHEERIR